MRYSETDAMGFVYHTNYLVWFEVGRAEYMRAIETPYSELEKTGVYLPLVECSCRFHCPGKYDDPLIVRTSVTELTRIKIKFRYDIIRSADERLLAEGSTTHAFTDSTGKPTRLKSDSPAWERMRSRIEAVDSLHM
ncbi:MAG: acyl-CoA thioesterase [Chloroflexi bacterium]|nr:acyl-CoA thioesterase [Chloroflexota bacterium]